MINLFKMLQLLKIFGFLFIFQSSFHSPTNLSPSGLYYSIIPAHDHNNMIYNPQALFCKTVSSIRLKKLTKAIQASRYVKKRSKKRSNKVRPRRMHYHTRPSSVPNTTEEYSRQLDSQDKFILPVPADVSVLNSPNARTFRPVDDGNYRKDSPDRLTPDLNERGLNVYETYYPDYEIFAGTPIQAFDLQGATEHFQNQFREQHFGRTSSKSPANRSTLSTETSSDAEVTSLAPRKSRIVTDTTRRRPYRNSSAFEERQVDTKIRMKDRDSSHTTKDEDSYYATETITSKFEKKRPDFASKKTEKREEGDESKAEISQINGCPLFPKFLSRSKKNTSKTEKDPTTVTRSNSDDTPETYADIRKRNMRKLAKERKKKEKGSRSFFKRSSSKKSASDPDITITKKSSTSDRDSQKSDFYSRTAGADHPMYTQGPHARENVRNLMILAYRCAPETMGETLRESIHAGDF